MTILEFMDYVSNLTGHVTFKYNGYSCGVDPLALDSFDMWFGDNETTVDSIEKVLNTKLFNGKSLTDIWEDVTELDY